MIQSRPLRKCCVCTTIAIWLLKSGFLNSQAERVPTLIGEKKLDKSVRGIIRVRMNRLRLGNFGDCKTIRGTTGLYEMRFHVGPGYRLYFGRVKETLIILLCGGDKGSQEHDIQKAKEYWQLYKDLLK